MTLTQLEAFTAAAKRGGFTAAADYLGMSQPAVSDLIRRLEKELGARLFQRAGRSVRLTAAGEHLLPYAEQAVAAAMEGARAVKMLNALNGGTAAFGVLGNMRYYLREDLGKKFLQMHPKVRLRLVGQNSAGSAADVASGALEAGFVSLPVDDENLEIVPVARDEVVYVSADAHRASIPPTIDDVCSRPLILFPAEYSEKDPARRQLNERARRVGKKIDPYVDVALPQTAYSMVLDGFGDTITCRAAFELELKHLGLSCVSFAEPMYDVLAFIKRSGAILSPATQEICHLAYELLSEFHSSRSSSVEVYPDSERRRAFMA